MKKTEKLQTAKRPIKTAGYSHAKSDARKAKRQNEADARQAKYEALSCVERDERDARLKREYEAAIICSIACS